MQPRADGEGMDLGPDAPGEPAGSAGEASPENQPVPRGADRVNGPSSTIGIGTGLGLGCLVLIVLLVVIGFVARSVGWL